MRTSFAAVLAATLCAPASAMPPAAPLPMTAGQPLKPVILDAGHGGWDVGAVAKGLGVTEKDLALIVTRKLRDRLVKDEMPVMLTRDDDNYVTLDQRVIDAVDWNGAMFVSIHLNQVRGKRYHGAIVYSFGHDRPHRRSSRRRLHPHVPPMPAPPRVESREGADLAEEVADAMRQDGFRVREDRSDYYVLKAPAQPSVLVELGYLSNPQEAALLADPAYQDKLAASLARAIEGYASNRALRGASAAAAPSITPEDF